MRRRTAIIGATAAGWLAARPLAAQPLPMASLDALLTPYLARFGLPALAAAVVQGGRISAAGAVGTRRAGAQLPVTLNDRFHIGSCTKAMTALLAGMLVDAGTIRWDSTIGSTFPALRDGMDAGFAAVTLEQLLSHIGGIPSDNDAIMQLILSAYGQDSLNLDGMRRWMVGQWRGRPLASPAGSAFAYSNLGYTIAGAMLETAAGSTWEELVSTRLFDPLRLTTAGIGPQSSIGRVDAPLGHNVLADGTLQPMLAGPNGDVPAVYGPAGAVHLSILDFATWAGWQAGGGQRIAPLVTRATMARLHTKMVEMPPLPDAAPGAPGAAGYGHGWGFATLPYTRGQVMLHTGSNSMNMAMVLVQPERDFALVVATNRSDPRADAVLKAVQELLYRVNAPRG